MVLNETDLMIGEAIYNVTNYTWQVSGDYRIGEAIEEVKQHNKNNLIGRLSYEDAIDSLGRVLMMEMPSYGDKGHRIGAIGTKMFILAHGYQSVATSRSAYSIFMDIYKYIYTRV